MSALTDQERRLELLEAFYRAWKDWCADASNVTERPLRELAAKLDAMEGK